MITLSQAFRLCDIRQELVWFSEPDAKNAFDKGICWCRTVRERVDMKKINVHRIRIHITEDGRYGFEFVVSGLTDDDRRKLGWGR